MGIKYYTLSQAREIAKIGEDFGRAVGELLVGGYYISGGSHGMKDLVRNMRKYRGIFAPLLRENKENHPKLRESKLELK